LTQKNERIPDQRFVTPDAAGMSKAARELASGQLVAFPTETVYGLGADATNEQAVASIFEAKGRPKFNPLIVHVPDIVAARRYVDFNDNAERLADAFWPGALTMVLPRRTDSNLSLLVSAGLDSVAVRVPSHPIAKALLKEAGCPVAAPSANSSGHVSPTLAEHVQHSWPDSNSTGPGVIVDGGPCQIGLESTVVEVDSDGCTLLRPGGITSDDLEKIVGQLAIADGSSDAPRSPGMLARHYAPATPVILNASCPETAGAFLGFGPNMPDATLNLSVSGSLREAAANLFAMLRQLDIGKFQSIAISPIPEDGLGRAINDRLRRAATTDEETRPRHE